MTERAEPPRSPRKRGAPDPLQTLPSVGPSLAADLRLLGVRTPEDLRGQDPQDLYDRLCALTGTRQDRCVLYCFRCAVHAASVPNPTPEERLWWNWKDPLPSKRRNPGRVTRS